MKATREEIKNLDRLIKRSDFLRAASSGRKWISKSMIVLECPNGLASMRVGITATKKLEKTAVGRNRMKRRLRALAADILPGHGRAGNDYVLIARTETMSRPYADLLSDLRWCLRKLSATGDSGNAA